MIIGLCLGIMVIITIFSIIIGGTSVISADFESRWLSVKSIGTLVEQKYKDVEFSLEALEGMLVIITVLITFTVLIGIRVIASGLADSSIKVVSVLTAYGGIWLILSILCVDLIRSIEIFGALLYITLTIAYVIGIVQKHVGV